MHLAEARFHDLFLFAKAFTKIRDPRGISVTHEIHERLGVSTQVGGQQLANPISDAPCRQTALDHRERFNHCRCILARAMGDGIGPLAPAKTSARGE